MQKIYSNYNKKTNWKICVSGLLFHFLKRNRDSFPSHLNWENLLLLSSKIEYKLSKKNTDFVEIPSSELKYYVRNYTEYLNFLIGIGAAEKKNYSTTSKKCNAYRFKYESFDFDSDYIHEIEIALKPKYYSVDSNCSHLTKWLDKRLEIDYFNFKLSKYSIVEKQKSQNDYDKAVLKALNYKISLLDLDNGYFRASRDISSDNRLHTNLTNFPSNLRQFITYDGCDLVSYDIKNSQPYFLMIFLERFEEVRIKRIFKRIYSSNIGIMSDKIQETLSHKEFQDEYLRLKGLILKGKLYEFLTDIIDFKMKDGKFLVKAYDKKTEKNYFKYFDTKREACKQTFMQILYSPNKQKYKQYKQFEAEFPQFCMLLYLLKTSTNRKDSYKKFPKLLQHIEADCILDFVTKKIAKEHPEMPMFTIHDSITTIDAYSDVLHRKMTQHLTEYSNGILPQLKEEYWGLNYTKIKEAS